MSLASSGEHQRFFFVHLQKTAGASLIRQMKTYFGRSAVYPNNTDGSNVPISMVMVDHLLERWQARRHEIIVVAGHFPLCTMQLLDARFKTMTIVRDPIERTLSYLRFHKKITPMDRHLTLETIYGDPFRFEGFIHNHMVKMLSLTVAEMTAGALTVVDFTQERLERAKANLARVDVVGTQERYTEFCHELDHRFGWDLGAPVHVNRSEPADAPERLRTRIAEDNALDLELYDFAQDLVARRRS